MEPIFSVVIAVFNKEKYVAETIQSVLDQSYPYFEIVILNDGSTDYSEREILKFKDPRIHYFSQENQGAAAARNNGIKKTKNPYIALLDADDYWFPFYLEEQRKSIEMFPKEFVFATAAQLKTNNTVFDNRYSVTTNSVFPVVTDYFEGSYLSSILHSSSTVLHKSIFENVGWYDTQIKSGEDIDLYVRIGLKYKVVFNPKVCATYIIRKDSLVNTVKNLADKANFLKYEKFEGENPALKKFLDLNRYALCISAKLENDEESFQKNLKKINLKNLSKKQRFLLKQRRSVLKYLSHTKNTLEKLGLRLGTFK